jgi:hypothetical protein
MKFRWAALATVLALVHSVPRVAVAQAGQPSRDQASGSVLGQNYPNPFDRETTIPFAIGGGTACTDTNKQYRVSLKIYNMLAQLVAVPFLNSGGSSGAGGVPLREAILSCGNYSAFWDGSLTGSGRTAPSGVYLYRLEIDGRPIMRKMIIIR